MHAVHVSRVSKACTKLASARSLLPSGAKAEGNPPGATPGNPHPSSPVSPPPPSSPRQPQSHQPPPFPSTASLYRYLPFPPHVNTSFQQPNPISSHNRSNQPYFDIFPCQPKLHSSHSALPSSLPVARLPPHHRPLLANLVPVVTISPPLLRL
ncbi:hypothetical protein KSP39_PZI004082 [Platanthera zijinensis]|uniref:Uncharacterized protein n=1 Tax=Platanthera zijinensis TaxID=2320716 RepID=A0AAP0GDI9_9ASPA